MQIAFSSFSAGGICFIYVQVHNLMRMMSVHYGFSSEMHRGVADFFFGGANWVLLKLVIVPLTRC
jgi:hypothetical protein